MVFPLAIPKGDGKLRLFTIYKTFPENRVGNESKWNMKTNIWKDSSVFPDGLFHLWYQLQTIAVVFSK